MQLQTATSKHFDEIAYGAHATERLAMMQTGNQANHLCHILRNNVGILSLSKHWLRCRPIRVPPSIPDRHSSTSSRFFVAAGMVVFIADFDGIHPDRLLCFEMPNTLEWFHTY